MCFLNGSSVFRLLYAGKASFRVIYYRKLIFRPLETIFSLWFLVFRTIIRDLSVRFRRPGATRSVDSGLGPPGTLLPGVAVAASEIDRTRSRGPRSDLTVRPHERRRGSVLRRTAEHWADNCNARPPAYTADGGPGDTAAGREKRRRGVHKCATVTTSTCTSNNSRFDNIRKTDGIDGTRTACMVICTPCIKYAIGLRQTGTMITGGAD